jgi:MFS family permease
MSQALMQLVRIILKVQLICSPTFLAGYNIGLLSTCFSIGLAVGAFSWGILVDVIGRRWSFNLTCLISGVFGIASGASPSFTALRVLAAFVGVGVGGNIP